MTNVEHEDDDEEGHADDRGRVDHGRLDLSLEGGRLLDVGGEALEDDVEDTARLSDLDQVGEEVVERARMACAATPPGWSPPRTLRATLAGDARGGFFDSLCSARMLRHWTSGRPASIMVENWRVKIAISLSLTLPPTLDGRLARRLLGDLVTRIARRRSSPTAVVRSGASISPVCITGRRRGPDTRRPPSSEPPGDPGHGRVRVIRHRLANGEPP